MPQQAPRRTAQPTSAAPATPAKKVAAPGNNTPALLMAKLPAPGKVKRFSAAIVIGACASAVAHAFILAGLGFTVPDGGARKEKPRLDMVIVNAKHKQAPRNAQALAQANMDGGGNVDKNEMPTTPLPPEHTEQAGDAMVDASKRVESLEARQRTLLAQAKAIAAVEQATGRRSSEQAPSDAPRSGNAAEDKTRAMAKEEAAVERMLRQYAQRPRKTFVSPRTRESAFALYTVAWRKVVEDLGSLKFPKGDDGRALYGSVMLSIEIDRKGQLVNTAVERSSGNKRLDEAALRIVRMASPFKPLPPETARDTDILVMVETFRFQKVQGDSALEVKGGGQ
ncbi:TonB family protein [Uliginosibacterium sp. H3]|uniref:TonB family protein n=1 Tax=Uliginosibacterium silvisoli TaxID=3114758 RepID=A0ABU6K1U6_9RHOO|nr:TonB family protein [Uliginosibacterium sp. H3]